MLKKINEEFVRDPIDDDPFGLGLEAEGIPSPPNAPPESPRDPFGGAAVVPDLLSPGSDATGFGGGDTTDTEDDHDRIWSDLGFVDLT